MELTNWPWNMSTIELLFLCLCCCHAYRAFRATSGVVFSEPLSALSTLAWSDSFWTEGLLKSSCRASNMYAINSCASCWACPLNCGAYCTSICLNSLGLIQLIVPAFPSWAGWLSLLAHNCLMRFAKLCASWPCVPKGLPTLISFAYSSLRKNSLNLLVLLRHWITQFMKQVFPKFASPMMSWIERMNNTHTPQSNNRTYCSSFSLPPAAARHTHTREGKSPVTPAGNETLQSAAGHCCSSTPSFEENSKGARRASSMLFTTIIFLAKKKTNNLWTKRIQS